MHTPPLPDPMPESGIDRPGTTSVLRVSFLTHYTELYGANLSLLNLMDGLASYGVKSHVICPDQGDLLAALSQRAIPAAVLPFEWWVAARRATQSAATRLLKNIRQLRPIATQIGRWGCDLIYSNSSVFAIGALAAVELDLPHVWHLREFGRRDYDLLPDFGSRLSRLGFRTADATIFVSHALRRVILGRTSPANSHVIYNGVASEAVFDERRRAAESLRGRTQPFTFVLVGRFRESKGQAIAIRALRRSPTDSPTRGSCSSAAPVRPATRVTSNSVERSPRSYPSPTGSSSGVTFPIPSARSSRPTRH